MRDSRNKFFKDSLLINLIYNRVIIMFKLMKNRNLDKNGKMHIFKVKTYNRFNKIIIVIKMKW